MNDGRPDPDHLLLSIAAEEADASKGRLRIFLGMSAGVGKTYAMLRAARQRQAEKCKVVVGVVETHGRAETAKLLEGLEVIARKKISYRGAALEEMDLDAIISRKPDLVLVDELAHTNAPGSRHGKRYQDVIELLESGIDVYSTVNIQHLESRKEAVEAIALVPIRETIPDSILERAHLVELVDIAPSELLKRLREGKVYLGDKASQAAQNFFKEDILTALREIALRFTAEKVDQDLRKLSDHSSRTGPWQTNERLMVAVSHSPHSERLIRATRRIAYNLEAPWVAAHVDTGISLSEEDQLQLSKNLHLARELKAEVVTTNDPDVVGALRRISRQKNVTQIIVGRPSHRRLRDFIEGGTLLDRLVSESGDIDVHILRSEAVATFRPTILQTLGVDSRFGTFLSYWYAFWFIAGVGLLSAVLESTLGYQAVGFIFLLGVLVVGLFGTMGPVIFAAGLSTLTWNFFFIPPRLTIVINKPEDFIMCVCYFAVAAITGLLTSRVKAHERLIRDREDRTTTLYEISMDIASSRDKATFLTKVNERVGRLLDGTCRVILRGQDGKLQSHDDKPYSILLNEKERAVATWVFERGQRAGWNTETLSEAKGLYLPLKSSGDSVGVLVFLPNTRKKLTLEQDNLLHAIAQQLALSLEKHFFEKRVREADKLQASERLHQTLLSSISHELRTPLTVIMGNATALVDKNTIKNPKMIEEVASELLQASQRLNQVIENLLDMTRLSSGVLTLKREWHDVHDLVGIVIKKLSNQLRDHKLKTSIPSDLPLVEMDYRLMEHALSNLILNACTYAPVGTEILVSAARDENRILLRVQDKGPGIPADSLDKIFDKFYRVPSTKTGGTGLGLSIVKSIVEAHQGLVSVGNNLLGGAIFTIALPLGKMSAVPQEIDV